MYDGAAVEVRMGENGIPAASLLPTASAICVLCRFPAAGSGSNGLTARWISRPRRCDSMVYAAGRRRSIRLRRAPGDYRVWRSPIVLLPDRPAAGRGAPLCCSKPQGANGIESDPDEAVSCRVRTVCPEVVTILAAETIL